MKALPEEKVVYLTLMNVFKGRNASVRRLKVVRKLIEDAILEVAEVSNLTETFGVGPTSRVAQILLRDGIFESPSKANGRFPDIVNNSPDQDVDQEAPRQGDVNEVGSSSGAVRDDSDNVPDFASQIGDSEVESCDTCHDSSSSISKRRRTTMRPPSSVCFPLRTQDRILTQAQKLLEQACFEFCRRAMPDMLDRNQWDCVEAVELNRWVPELRLRQRELFGGYHDKLLQSMTDLRHTAVHRVRVTVQRLELFLLNAEKFTALLKDGTRQEMLARIRLKTQDVIRTLESRQGVLGSKRDEVERARAIKIAELDRVRATAIAELDRIRATAIAELDKEESEYQLSAVKPLEEILFPSATPTPMATVQGGEGRVTEDDSTESYLDPCRDSESQDIQG